ANGISLIGGGNGNFIEYFGDYGQYVIGQKTWQLSDSVTYMTGPHSLKFGGTLLRRDLTQQRTQLGKGFYFFNDYGPDPSQKGKPALGYTGYEVSDMLIGLTNFTTAANPGYVPRDTISWENSVFAQDDWHLNPKLTLNVGLRWDVFTPYYEKNNRMANFDPVTQQLVIPDQNGATRSTLKTDWNNFGPRLGFAYLLNEKTSLRGGYGIFYSLDRGGIDRQLTENPPAVVTEYRFSGPSSSIHLWDPIPLPTPVNPNSPVLPEGSGIVYVPANSQTTRVQQWNIDAEREIFSNTALMVAYVGNRGDHLAAMITAAGFRGDVRDRLSTTMYIGTSAYNALQASLRRSESFGLSYLASYTYGHATNNTVGFYAGAPSGGGNALATDTSCVARGTQNCNLNLDRGPADYDVRNRFTLAATYALPFMRQSPVLGGWSVNMVYAYQSGLPFTVFSNGKRVDIVGDPHQGASLGHWVDPAAFRKAAGAQGTEGRNAFRGPSTNSLDLSVFKTFTLGRPGAVELRVEGFNILNKPQYNLPNVNLGDGTFGQINGTRTNT
ncbi:MAG TPA: TonB-dependent receptor, partial [Thermoanaerobaculia bacterium]|nr:TonB-dependent receptor [Thermoanaerobaculia bacterium]